jgi:tRNA(Arg) A34 adenosine deaminase TadA
MDDTAFMREAIAKARAGIRAGQTPFGAAVVHGGRVLVAAHNTVWRDTDPTAHAEVGALRQAARLLERIDLAGCDLFTTCEPCPMCLAATHWAKVDRVVFGATIEDAAAAGFTELFLPAREMVERGGSRLRVEGGVCREECRELFRVWKEMGLSAPY